jgi:hypothetical protein
MYEIYIKLPSKTHHIKTPKMATKVALIVNTCDAYYRKTIPWFIQHAIQSKIQPEDILVVVGESETNNPLLFQIHCPSASPDVPQTTGPETAPETQYNRVFCPYVNIDFNAAIFLSQTQQGRKWISEYTHFFYLHDTTQCLPQLGDRLAHWAPSCSSYIKLQATHTKNIGLFNTMWFLDTKSEFLSAIINTDHSKKMDYKCGEFPNKRWIYENISGMCPWNLNEDTLFLYCPNTEQPIGEYFHNHVDYYYTHLFDSPDVRLASIYNEPGIVKFQRNWGQPGEGWKMTL